LFDGKLPTIPISWALIKDAGGVTYYKGRGYGRPIVPGSLRMEISTRFKRTEQGLDAILIHEMIHAYLASTYGDGDGKHGYRFQSMAHILTAKVGFQIPLTDDTRELEVTHDEQELATVLMSKHITKGWHANFFSGTAFDNPKKMDELVAFWGTPGRLKEGEEILVIKIRTNLMHKYARRKGVAQMDWYKLSSAEEENILQHGQIIRRILPGSVSHEDAASRMPVKDVLVVLQTTPGVPGGQSTFLMPNIARDPVKLKRLIDKWKPYHNFKNHIEIFTTKSTLFNTPRFSMFRDEEKGSYYNLKPESVEELRRNAQYIERWT
jgi:hypothetical protein